jgi:hypothetical protein
MDTALRGNAAEAAVLSALVGRGFHVLIPFGGGHPYDLVIYLETGEFVRVQCKAAREARNGCLQFNGRTTDHGRGRLRYDGLADVFGVHDAATGRVFLVPVRDLGIFVVSLRVAPTANNQQRGVRFAVDYAIERWDAESLRDLVAGSVARVH